jgi:hypothetical protein
MEKNKSEWSVLLDEILWTYRTIPRESTQQSPYSLVYDMKAVTPMELVLSSLHTTNYNVDSNSEERRCELEFVDEAREQVRTRMTEYQRRILKIFDKHVAPRHFQPGDLVLQKMEATGKQLGKLDPAWEGPFRIVHSHHNGAYKLETLEGKEILRTWNAIHLHKFFD